MNCGWYEDNNDFDNRSAPELWRRLLLEALRVRLMRRCQDVAQSGAARKQQSKQESTCR